jgi:hypothetical protein
MAVSHYGVETTKSHNTTPPFKVASKNRHGRKRVSYDEYEASAIAPGSQVAMGWVPAGARFLGGRIQHDALGSGTTLAVGDQFDCDRFRTTMAAASANSCAQFDVIGDLSGRHSTGVGYEFECDTLILVTVPYASGAVTGTIKLQIDYSTD